MFFASDNWAGAHPAIAESLVKEASGYASAYGTSDLDRRVEAHFNQIFEREVAVFFVGTGTAANSLALASVARAGGVTFCHFDAHVNADEGGAPEYLSHASRLYPIEGRDGKMSPSALHTAVSRFDTPSVHQGRPMAVTITQATETGTIYTLDEIDAISAIARSKGLPLHMDGARFANALVALDVTPAEMTWKRGVDILSFGATKNGCWCVEAIVFFNPDMAEEMPYIRKRSAQLFSKTRFVSAQLEAYFEGDLWLDLARHANAMSDRLRAGLRASNKARLAWETESNEVFAVISKEASRQAQEKGAKFYEWLVPRDEPDLVGPDDTLIRLVTSFATTPEDVDRFLDVL
ncbi:threonine aldolase family protein [Allorhizobium taibaishanense]|uniref:L-threonine aldolase n=1 Tax=Allorhizobium taibaishanense TaxID=887144 RepID=A0A1Q9A4Y3_9HYPH|nr:low specificity L-threonine aldolase [Allorhizobium taibaishanense]MBB4006724.1 threonine aldolase [Allorhizobium taibaishanense]OLP49626.1 threonine aldolase [Allorhizobium taibaishanense]